VAIELFEFAESPSDWRSGIFHICLAVGDVDSLAARIAAAGGRRRTARAWEIFPGEPYLTCYCEDPFGNVLELYSHSHERTWANRI
jgi:catechol-2,3-dioxygenase